VCRQHCRVDSLQLPVIAPPVGMSIINTLDTGRHDFGPIKLATFLLPN
jgi:hypothetical protein